jgi:cbb3-type cytochrome c oxidase subunit III
MRSVFSLTFMRARSALPLMAPLIAAQLVMVSLAFGQDPAARPPEVTDSAVAEGRRIFQGVGGCSACHGMEGGGTDSGAPLAQGVWMHGADTWRAIRSRVLHGIPKDESTRGTTMPIRGMSELTDAQVDAVASYVWVISHQAIQPKPTTKP